MWVKPNPDKNTPLSFSLIHPLQFLCWQVEQAQTVLAFDHRKRNAPSAGLPVSSAIVSRVRPCLKQGAGNGRVSRRTFLRRVPQGTEGDPGSPFVARSRLDGARGNGARVGRIRRTGRIDATAKSAKSGQGQGEGPTPRKTSGRWDERLIALFLLFTTLFYM